MDATVTRTSSATRLNLAVPRALTALVIVLGTIAAAGGLFLPGLYRDPAGFVPVLQGQDLVTLLAMPALVVTLVAAGRGSARGAMVWVGLLGYVLYTYAGASLGYYFNRFFLIYVALFSLSIFALMSLLSSLDVTLLRRSFDATTPRKPVIAFMILIALMLAALELGENLSFLTTGTIPKILQRSGGVTNFVYVFDLGMIAPLTVLSAVWLWKQAPWGYVLAGCMLIKGAAMGLALLSMEWFSLQSGQGSDGLEAMWAIIALGSLGLALWFYRHCMLNP